MDPFVDPASAEEADLAAHLLSWQAGLYAIAWERDQRLLAFLRDADSPVPPWWERGEIIIGRLLGATEDLPDLHSSLCRAIDQAVIDGDTTRRSG
ncbi:MAG: hypothetical protein Q8Q02_09130 [Nocardioides sp.]|nr:hypothetical protein [Nocardioides sp.]